MSNEPLHMWTIYEHPLDYPEHFVVREWICCDPPLAGPARLAETLEAARLLVPPHLYRQPRNPDDDPFIVETWM